MRLFAQLLCVMALTAAAPAFAKEPDSGFGQPFAAVPHPGFSDPVSSTIDPAAIEPAAGEEETATEIDNLMQPSFEVETDLPPQEAAPPAAE